MGKTKLFDAWTFKRHLQMPFDNSVKKRTDSWSKYNTAAEKSSTLHAQTLSAVFAYMELDKAAAQTELSKGAIGTRDRMIIAEYPSHRAGETHVCQYNRETGKFIAGVYKNGSSIPEAYEMKANGQSGSALFFALMPIALEDIEFNCEYEKFYQQKRMNFPYMEASEQTAALLCDNLYRRIENADNLGDSGIKVNIPGTGNIQPFNILNMDAYSPAKVIAGKFEILKPKSPPKETVDKSDFEGKYTLSARIFTDEEKLIIPSLPEWYVIPPEVVQICRHAKMTTDSTVQMRNFMLRGPAGTGKTEGARAIAAGLGLPYASFTCSANTEITDLLGQILPETNISSGDKISAVCESYPSLLDIQMDPATAYCKMTGVYDEKITEYEVYNKLIETIQSNAKKQINANENQRFRYVDTALVNAIRYGWLCEIQEPSIIANPGVLVGLNSLMDNGNTVTLPTGETIRRHPDTVIIVTVNVDYSGCRDLNQSVISRMNLIFDVEEPDIDTLTERVLNITKCPSKTIVRQMAEAVREISEKCRETMITDGSCGVRELISWAQSYMVCGNILDAAKYTVLSSVSKEPDNRAEIYSTCLEPKFAAAENVV